MEKQHEIKGENLKENLKSVNGSCFSITDNVWWLGEVPPCTNVEL
jgi:hypothetical protein